MNLDALNLEALRPLIPMPMLAKLGVLALVVVLILGAYYIIFWSPLEEAIDSERAQVEQQRIILKKNERLASNLPKKRAEYKQLQVQLKVALNLLPKKSQIPDLLEGVAWAGKDSGLSFTAFTPGAEQVKSIYAEVPVALGVSGTFKQLLTFLKRVGEMSRIVSVKDLSLRVGANQNLSVTGQVLTYRFVEDEKKGKR